MNTSKTILTIALLTILAGAGCTTQNKVTTPNTPIENISSTKNAEQKLGFKIPADAKIDIELDNELSYTVTFFTNVSIRDAKSLFTETLAENGYSISREFGKHPQDNDTQATASFTKQNGETIGITIKALNSKTQITLVRQY